MKAYTKTISLILISIMILTIPSLGQEKSHKNRKEQMEKMKSMKIAFITENLELTSSEAEKFWPLYNEYESAREELMTEYIIRYIGEGITSGELEQPDDEQAEIMIQKIFDAQQELLDLKTEYYEKYLEILSASRILKLYEVEDNFRRHLMGRMSRGGDAPQDRKGQEGTPEGKGVAPPCKDRGHRSVR